MTNKIRGVAVAFLSVLAIGGVSASAASASNFNFEAVESRLEGAQTTMNTLTLNAGSFNCQTATVTSGWYGKGAKESVSLIPKYECSSWGTPLVWSMNGCTEKITAKTASTASFAFVCPEGKQIDIELKGAGCHIYIPGHTPATPSVGLINGGSGSTRNVQLQWQLRGISYTSTGGLCGAAGASSNGTLTGTMLVKAKGSSAQAGFWVS